MKLESQITPIMETEYLRGTLPGLLSTNPNFGLLHLYDLQVCEILAQRTGQRVEQRQRGVTVWK